MPPDEYQGHISNSIYTNLIANYAVNTAKWLACLVDEGKINFTCYSQKKLDKKV